MKTLRTFCNSAALPLMLCVATAAAAQDAEAQPAADASQMVDFAADHLTYDSEADVVTASGEVRMSRARGAASSPRG